ncbi:hypothetical protein ACFXHA_40830 [Nocardia sp. NPDC059240]|uniref:AfsR/SARP family transcriptional regulator n=1 Tax=Nocardia sp. NPDC059240 TaxID=3346786 RepID=UPI00367A606B
MQYTVQEQVVVSMLIAVAGLGPHTGATTTALALAAAWPATESVILVEADPHGGVLAAACGGYVRRGLASMAAASAPRAAAHRVELVAHLQWHPAGVAYLAAPPVPGPHASREVLAALRRPGPGREWSGELVVIADCGNLTNPRPSPLIVDADLLLLVLGSQRRDTVALEEAVAELAARYPRLAIVSIGSEHTGGDSVDRLPLPVLGRLPHTDDAATLWSGRVRLYESGFAEPAGALAAAVRAHVNTGTTTPASPEPPSAQARTAWHGPGGRARHDRSTPHIYRISLPGSGNPVGGPVHPARALGALTTSPHTQARVPIAEPVAVVSGSCETAPMRPVSVGASSAHTAPAPDAVGPVLALRLFGPVRVMWRPARGEDGQGGQEVEITMRLQRRSREVLALLATHPHGLTRDQLIDALWGEACPPRAVNALHTTLGRVRTALSAATDGTGNQVLITDAGRYVLDPAAVHLDYADFTTAVAARRRAGTDAQRRDACQRIVDLAVAGVLAEDLDADWLPPLREAARSDARTALGVLAALLAATDPRAALDLLETVLVIDPHNERLYQDMLRLHARLGEHYVLDLTLALAARRLAEIGEKPSRETLELVSHLKNTQPLI